MRSMQWTRTNTDEWTGSMRNTETERKWTDDLDIYQPTFIGTADSEMISTVDANKLLASTVPEEDVFLLRNKNRKTNCWNDISNILFRLI